jgi:hypothetical protein
LQQSITNDDICFTTVQPIVMRVAKTLKYDAKGFPVYLVEIQGAVRVRPPLPTT